MITPTWLSLLVIYLSVSQCSSFSPTASIHRSTTSRLMPMSSSTIDNQQAIKDEKADVKTTPSSSRALQSILGEETMDHFFENVWQKSPRVYRSAATTTKKETDTEYDPLANQVHMGLPGITRALDAACQTFLEPPTPEWQNYLPLVMNRDKRSLTLNELAPLYGNDLFAAYLDGCSVVLNHCDRHCPHAASLCDDLQRSFPFAYANAYLTPPNAQSVSAHADDRDVFVVQVYGTKSWRVYEEVPVPYPYPREQVGKNGRSVPVSVLEGGRAVDTELRPGDVLYIPRGYVHEARNSARGMMSGDEGGRWEPSYHVTIALATFDWALSGLLSDAMRQTLDEEAEYRMAVPVAFGMREDVNDIPLEQRQGLERQVDDALKLVREKVTAEAINNYLKQKYDWHTSKSRPYRLARIAAAEEEANRGDSGNPGAFIGRDAVKGVTMDTVIRVSTSEERERVGARPKRFLRKESADALNFMLEYLQNNPSEEIKVAQLPALLDKQCQYVCDLTLVSFVRSCVERGEVVIVNG